MKNFEEKVMEAAKGLVDIVEISEDFGIDFSECVPAMSFFVYEKDGKSYAMKLELSIKRSHERS